MLSPGAVSHHRGLAYCPRAFFRTSARVDFFLRLTRGKTASRLAISSYDIVVVMMLMQKAAR
ncbi:MAG: hypothetical protein AAF368_09225, partial [Planctomycetota bacterium]